MGDLLSLPSAPLCIIGDFNVVLGAHERLSGTTPTCPTSDFQDFLSSAECLDIDSAGSRFTWVSRRPHLIMAKLDRVVANSRFLDLWSSVSLIVLPRLCSDQKARLKT